MASASANNGGSTTSLAFLIVLLAAAAAVELVVTPSDLWPAKLVGHNALHCLTIIPALSLFPAFFLFLAMRNGAPENPGIAGAIAAPPVSTTAHCL